MIFIKAIVEIVILLVTVIGGFRELRYSCLHNFFNNGYAFLTNGRDTNWLSYFKWSF